MHHITKSWDGSDEHLHAAVEAGHVQQVDDLLTDGATVNCFRHGVTPAGRAVLAGNARMLAVILNHKPNLHLGLCTYSGGTDTGSGTQTATLRGTWGGTNTATVRGAHRGTVTHAAPKCQRHREQRVPLLLMAAEKGDAHIVRLLLQHGADPNESEEVKNRSALHIAAECGHEDVVRELLQHEAYVNRLDLGSNAALHHAACRGYINVTRVLLQEGAAVNLPGEEAVFPLHAAARDGNKDMVCLLLEYGALIYLQDGRGCTALHHAASAGRADITQLLLAADGGGADWRTDSGETALGIACEEGHVDVVRVLLESQQVYPENGTGRGAGYRLPLQIAAAKGSIEILRLLLHHGAYINQQDPIHGQTALHWAVHHHQTAAILELLHNEAKVNIRDSVHGQTALHLACTLDTHGTFLDVTRLLLTHGANINLTEHKTLNTPLHIAARHGGTDLVDELIKQETFLHSLNTQNAHGETPLMVAARGGHCDVMDRLMHAGSQLMMTSLPRGDNALHIAIRNCHYTAAILLIRHGCNVNTVNVSGETALTVLIDLIQNMSTDDTELVNLVNCIVFVGVRCGGKQHAAVRSAVIHRTHHDRSDMVNTGNSNNVQYNKTSFSPSLSAAMLSTLQPPRLYSGCVAAVRQTLVQGTGGISILPSITQLPIPQLIKHQLALSYCPNLGSSTQQ